jgi:UDP-N-acetylmuramate: L-alanyl-gamma-D-glutamyl-meso-diaminopimelate ligase
LGKGNIFVIEGDEYDTAYFDKGPKFLHYLPEVVVLNNIEFDHADIYSDLSAIRTAFERLVNLIPRRGLLVCGSESPVAAEIAEKAPCRVETFSVTPVTHDATWRLEELETSQSGCRFAVVREGREYGVMEGPFWGHAALRNVLAAVAACRWLGLTAGVIGEGVSSYQGVRRRLEVRGEVGDVIVVDDFAHHPTAIRETIRASRLRWPNRRIWAVFEPRSFTARSKTFQEAMPEALAEADCVILAAVFSSARLPSEQELSEEEVIKDIERRGGEAWFLPHVEGIVEHIAARAKEGDVVLAMSNGGFGGLHQKLLNALSKRRGGP